MKWTRFSKGVDWEMEGADENEEDLAFACRMHVPVLKAQKYPVEGSN